MTQISNPLVDDTSVLLDLIFIGHVLLFSFVLLMQLKYGG